MRPTVVMRLTVILLLFGLAVTSAAHEREDRVSRVAFDDFNSWTLWSRNDEGAWTAVSHLYLSRRDCIHRLDLVELLYLGAERPSKTGVVIPAAAVARSPEARQIARRRFPQGPPAELRCLPFNADPGRPPRK